VATGALPVSGDGIHPAARKLLVALAQRVPGKFTWGQAASPASSQAAGISMPGARNCGRPIRCREGRSGHGTAEGLRAAGEVPPAPSTPAERLAMWCDRLRPRHPRCWRTLGGGHWNSGIAILRNNGLIETDGRQYRTAVLFRN
jgi:hypothetical protein